MLQIAKGLYTQILVLINDTANTSLNILVTDFHDMYVWLGIPVQFISNTGY